VAAHNLKSIVLNIITIMVFVWPFIAYFKPEVTYAPVLGGAAVIALLVPPMGWKRPHPYSDMPSNRP
jgi:hypothetical protein